VPYNGLPSTDPSKKLILTDWFSVLQALDSKTWGKHYIVTKVLLLYHKLTIGIGKSKLKITFLWVPSHSGITGNETADCLTKHIFRYDSQCSINDVQLKRNETKLSYAVAEVKFLFVITFLKSGIIITYLMLLVTTMFLFSQIKVKNSIQSKQIFRLQTGHFTLRFCRKFGH